MVNNEASSLSYWDYLYILERLCLVNGKILLSAISSISSIDAAFGATPGEYIYFVADSSKSHYFSKTYDEHLNKIRELGLYK